MRISERKRQLREFAKNPDVLADRQAKRVTARSEVVAPKPSRTPRASTAGDAKSAPAASTRVRKRRSTGFYKGFGYFGLLFSLLLAYMTVTSYNTDKDKYPTKLAQYHTAQVTYTAKYAAYQTAIKKHVAPAPTAPKKPSAPSKPVLNAWSFSLPVLYIALSLAYLYIAYRAKDPQDRAAELAARRRAVHAPAADKPAPRA